MVFPSGMYDKIGDLNCTNEKDFTCAMSVLKNGKWGCVDEKNKVLLPFIYDSEFEYRDTMWVSKNNKWGRINSRSVEISPFEYDDVIPGTYDNFDIWDSIYFDYYTVEKNGKWGCIDETMQILLPLKYDKPVDYADTMFVVRNGKWECIDKQQKKVIEFTFDTDTSYVQSMSGKNLTKWYGSVIVNDKYDYSLQRNTVDIAITEGYEIVKRNDSLALKLCLQFMSPRDKEYLLMYALDRKKYNLFCMIAASKPDFNEYVEAINIDAPISRVVGVRMYEGNWLTHDDKYILIMLDALIKAGADPNQKNDHGETPLICYLSRTDSPDIEVVRVLLKAGAKVKIRNENGKDALYYAKKAPVPVKELLEEYKKKE